LLDSSASLRGALVRRFWRTAAIQMASRAGFRVKKKR
jgi:hypothetical protein